VGALADPIVWKRLLSRVRRAVVVPLFGGRGVIDQLAVHLVTMTAAANKDSAPVVDGVVDDDGNLVVPSSQLPGHLSPGTHVRLRLVSDGPSGDRRSIYGALPDLPDLTWEDFEKASRLAVADTERRSSPE